jgi:hypothetical protein
MIGQTPAAGQALTGGKPARQDRRGNFFTQLRLQPDPRIAVQKELID